MWAPSVLLCGGMAVRCTDRKPRSYDYAFPRKKLLGALRSALAAKLADGKLVVVDSFELKEAKTKTFRKTLNKLNAKGTTLLVEKYIGETEKNLHLELTQSRRGGAVGGQRRCIPITCCAMSSAVFSRPALEKLQDSLKASAPKRKPRRWWRNEIGISDHSPPGHHGKGPGREGNGSDAGVRGCLEGHQDRDQEAVQSIFKVKVDAVRTANFVGKERRRGKFTGYRPDWKKAYVRLKAGEKMPEYAENL